MKIKCVLIIILIPFLLMANTIEIEKPIIEKNAFQNDLPIMMTSGKPAMPYIPVKILLPMGENLSEVRITLLNQGEFITNQYIDFARTPQPISLAGPDNTKKDEEIYTHNQFYPKEDYTLLGVQRLNGYDIALVNIFPYKYNPVTGEVVWFKNAEIEYSSESNLSVWEEQNKVLLGNEETVSRISNLVVNNEELSSYKKSGNVSNRTLVDPSDPYSLIIITDSERESFFDDFITWKNDHGIITTTFLTSDIYNEYTGVNDQEKIKNFIYDAYTTYSGTVTPLEYVILGGDDEIIPIRTVYINTGNGTMDWNMPCDLYYGCLDNDWDGDGDGIYGEIEDNVDMVPEVSIGRIPAETETEFNHFFYKTYQYVDEIAVSNDIVYLFGENLNWNPLTWGGDYKDEVAMLTPSLEQDYHVFRLFEREGTYSADNVKDAINSGVSIMNHMGHSNETIVFGQNVGHATSYTNTEYGFAYTQGCYPAAFDEATSYGVESIGENLVICEGGLFAFVGNTRYGWYSPGSTNGPSQPYDIEFFDAIFNENIRQLGKALDESRIVLANQAISNVYLRWVHYELVLFGDPSIEVKAASGEFPYLRPINAIYDDTEFGDGDNTPNPGEQIDIYI
nr:gingipain R [Candidatus Cloacimonadota bacterium]